MKTFAVRAVLSVTLASGILWCGPASAGSKTIVNNTDHRIKAVGITRCADDPGCTAGKVKIKIDKGTQAALDYPTTYLNQLIVSGPESCAVTVNVRGDAGDDTMNTNSTLTVSDLDDQNQALKGICTIAGSNP